MLKSRFGIESRDVDRYFPESFTYVKLAHEEVLPEAETEYPPKRESSDDEEEETVSERAAAIDEDACGGKRVDPGIGATGDE